MSALAIWMISSVAGSVPVVSMSMTRIKNESSSGAVGVRICQRAVSEKGRGYGAHRLFADGRSQARL
jgi:hypothetical protein